MPLPRPSPATSRRCATTNRPTASWANRCPANSRRSPGRGCLRYTRLGYPHTLCCVGAVNRIVPNYIMHMWMATGDGGLAATLYGPCSVSATVGENIPVKLTCETAYPFEESIRVKVEPDRAASWPLRFRIPSWCNKPQIAINGSASEAKPDEHGFVCIERQWAKGDTVTLNFPMSVRLERGFETEYPASTRKYFDFKSDVFFERRRLPYESVHYGPLLMALAIPDKDPNTPLPGARWQYALDNDAGRKGADIKIERKPMPAKWDWPLDAPLCITVPARSFDWQPTDDSGVARRSLSKACNRDHPPDSLRLHEVSDLDVPGDGQGVGKSDLRAVASESRKRRGLAPSDRGDEPAGGRPFGCQRGNRHRFQPGCAPRLILQRQAGMALEG